ncbi:MAG: FAD binding domain-containing protein, partial [Treponema sp.]|nr:FAD binding domain-containing protein [Treponema sp.]
AVGGARFGAAAFGGGGSGAAGSPAGVDAAPSPQGEGETRSGALHGLRAASLEHSARTKAPELPVEERRLDLEDVATIGEAEAAEEAGRCLDCSCVAVNASDVAPALLALGASVHTTRRRLDAEDFFAVRRSGSTRLLPGELVMEIRVPPQRKDCRFSFQKFRIRKSIDFPIVSVASAIAVEGGRIVEARLAFGAVAPVPVRAREVERFLVGRVPNDETAEEAGLVAIRDAVALAQNGYKLQILKALVRKAVLGLA